MMLSQVSVPNNAEPRRGTPASAIKIMHPEPISNPMRAAVTRSQNVLRLRAATRSSRPTIGKNVISEN
jgi:hypothetical protein